MATIVTRAGKGSPLDNTEVDSNFSNLNNDKLESGSTASSLTITSADINGGTIDGVTIGGSSAAAITGTTITGTSFVSSGDMTFGDNDKAIFGAGSDLQIYHDGSNSYIKDAGTGHLQVWSNDLRMSNAAGTKSYLYANDGGATVLNYDGSQKLATTSTGIDVTGTVTADAIDVAGASGAQITVTDNSPSNVSLYMGAGNSSVSIGSTTSDPLAFLTANTERLRIASNGDISFYEDTGTTAKFFWDASAESLGIGTSSPTNQLHISGTGSQYLYIDSTDNSTSTFVGATATGSIIQAETLLAFRTGGSSERMRIDSSGNVGIGTSSVASKLEVYDSGTFNARTSGINVHRPGSYGQYGSFAYNSNTTFFSSTYSGGGAGSYGQFVFQAYDSTSTPAERMRINASGNVGIGTSSPTAKLSVDGSAVFNESGADVDFRIESDTQTHAFFLQGSDGYIGIRHNAPLRPIHVKGAGYSAQILIEGTQTGYTEGAVVCLNSSASSPQTRGGGIFMADASDNVEWFAGRPYSSNDRFIIARNGSYTDYGGETAQTTHALVTVNYNGNVGIGTGAPAEKLDVNGSIKASGIYLGGTGAANYLDDYEEGTFDVTLRRNGYAAGDHTLACSYRKIGNTVIVNFVNDGTTAPFFYPNGNPTSTGDTVEIVSQLPFTPARGNCGVRLSHTRTLADPYLLSIGAQHNSTAIYLGKVGVGNSYSLQNNAVTDSAQSNITIIGTLVYQTD